MYQECKKCENIADLVYDREQGNWCAVNLQTWLYVSPLVWGIAYLVLSGVFGGVVRILFRGKDEAEGEDENMEKVE